MKRINAYIDEKLVINKTSINNAPISEVTEKILTLTRLTNNKDIKAFIDNWVKTNEITDINYTILATVDIHHYLRNLPNDLHLEVVNGKHLMQINMFMDEIEAVYGNFEKRERNIVYKDDDKQIKIFKGKNSLYIKTSYLDISIYTA